MFVHWIIGDVGRGTLQLHLPNTRLLSSLVIKPTPVRAAGYSVDFTRIPIVDCQSGALNFVRLAGRPFVQPELVACHVHTPTHICEERFELCRRSLSSRSNTVFAFAPFKIAELISTGTVPDYFPPGQGRNPKPGRASRNFDTCRIVRWVGQNLTRSENVQLCWFYQ